MPRFNDPQAEHLARYRADKTCFGGALLRGNPKGRRPFSSKQALHVVLRSSLARGRRSLLSGTTNSATKKIVRRQAERFDIAIYRFANSGNHLHLLIKPASKRAQYAGFIRAISGLIARMVLKAERGQPKGQKFWDARPFSRIVSWGASFRRCADYISKNVFEIAGLNSTVEAEGEWRAWLQSWPRPG